MADIASLLANAAQTNADFNFGKLNKSYWEGLEQAYKQRGRDAFQDPSLYGPDGQIDPAKGASAALKAGGLLGVEPASKLGVLGVLQQQMGNAAAVEMEERGGRPIPPSLNQNNFKADQPDLTQGRRGAQTPQAVGGDQKGSLVGFLSANGVPDEVAGPDLNILGGKLSKALKRRVDLNETLDMNNPQVRGILTDYVRSRQQSPQQPQVAQAPVVPPQQVAPQQPQIVPQDASAQRRAVDAPAADVDPDLGGLIPKWWIDRGGTAATYLDRVNKLSGANLPEAKINRYKAEANEISKYLQANEKMKTARARGMTVEELVTEEEKIENLKTLTKEVDIPTLKESKDKAKAAKEEIASYHRAKEQMDAPGGIFSGTGATNILDMAKFAAKFLGVKDVENTIRNTEAFRSEMSSSVLQTVKQLGSGSGITNADVKFAEDMVAKRIELDEGSIRRIVNLAEKVARRRIADHNDLVTRTIKVNKNLVGRDVTYKEIAPPMRTRIGGAPKVGDVISGREYYGGPMNKKESWGDKSDQPDTWRAQ